MAKALLSAAATRWTRLEYLAKVDPRSGPGVIGAGYRKPSPGGGSRIKDGDGDWIAPPHLPLLTLWPLSLIVAPLVRRRANRWPTRIYPGLLMMGLFN